MMLSMPRFRVLAPLVLALAAAAPIAQAQTTVPDSREQIRLSFAPVVKRLAPAVVNIRIRATQQAQNPLYSDPFYRRFFGDEQNQGQGQDTNRAVGSGVILRDNGVIVTNHHVVKSGGQIEVILNDKRTFSAKVLLSDERTDLAVLQIDAKGEKLPFLELRDSDEVEVGDLVLAVGNPFGVGQTVTSGIVSAIARTSVNISDFRSFIQTDAPINPGNSGGALATLDGKLVGINTAILSRSGGSVGIGFAIPSNMVAAVVRAAVSGGRIQRPTLGIGGQDVTADIAKARGIERIGGVIVSQVQPNSPATAAGVRVNDIIIKINGRDVVDIQDLRFRVATLPVGGTVKLTILRDKQTVEIDVPLREAAATEMDAAESLTGSHPLAGAQVVKFTAAVAERLNIRGQQRGLAIVSVIQGSNAHKRGFRERDVVLQINGVAIDSIEALRRALDQAQGMWQIVGSREGNLFRVFFSEQ